MGRFAGMMGGTMFSLYSQDGHRYNDFESKENAEAHGRWLQDGAAPAYRRGGWFVVPSSVPVNCSRKICQTGCSSRRSVKA